VHGDGSVARPLVFARKSTPGGPAGGGPRLSRCPHQREENDPNHQNQADRTNPVLRSHLHGAPYQPRASQHGSRQSPPKSQTQHAAEYRRSRRGIESAGRSVVLAPPVFGRRPSAVCVPSWPRSGPSSETRRTAWQSPGCRACRAQPLPDGCAPPAQAPAAAFGCGTKSGKCWPRRRQPKRSRSAYSDSSIAAEG
jgi:hypothetical protein